jgi:hypothetical protein
MGTFANNHQSKSPTTKARAGLQIAMRYARASVGW